MADYSFDTSALVKRHVDETGSKWVRSLIRAKTTYRIYIARITTVEIFAAITRRQHGGDLSAARAGAMLGHFRRHLDQRYRGRIPRCRGQPLRPPDGRFIAGIIGPRQKSPAKSA